jgi:hypothetical protein
MFSGLFWSGQQAIGLGLAERPAKGFGAAMGEGAVKALKTLPQLR